MLIQWECRPWEAPEQVLRDAGVELGWTYPAPVVSPGESQRHLQKAAKAVRAALERPERLPEVQSADCHNYSHVTMHRMVEKPD